MGKVKNLIDIFRNKPKSNRPGLSKEEVVTSENHTRGIAGF